MTNPVLVEVTRGDMVESRHRGAVIVVDADGKTVLEIGDVLRPVFPRSAIKSIQALPLLESGAADAYGFTNKEIALTCASHSGEPAHAALASEMLAKAGLDVTAMECGAHWPTRQDTALDLARGGARPSALHNNCSGKHAGFICTCAHQGIDTHGYVGAGHRAQQAVRDAMEAVTGAAHAVDACGTDGCSIPTYAVPLKSLALGFARMATGVGLGRERAAAAKRILTACMAESFFIAGTDKLDTVLMQKASGRIMAKVGAEGVYCASIPELGLGIAIKCDDGTIRAAEIMVASVLAGLMADKDQQLATDLREMANPIMKNWNGITVGGLRPTDAIS